MYFNPFELLGVTYKSSIKNLREQYKNLALIMHPDKGGNQDDMIKLHQSYTFVKEQLEFADHDKTYEGLEEDFTKFCKIQAKEKPKLPSLLNIIHNDDFVEKFNDAFEEERDNGNVYPLSYEKGYEEELKSEDKIEKALVIYEEPTASRYNGYSEHLYLGNHKDMTDFTNYNDGSIGTDFLEAYGTHDETYIKFQKNFLDEKKFNMSFEDRLKKLKEERK
jgi:hypothetical protein